MNKTYIFVRLLLFRNIADVHLRFQYDIRVVSLSRFTTPNYLYIRFFRYYTIKLRIFDETLDFGCNLTEQMGGGGFRRIPNFRSKREFDRIQLHRKGLHW